MINVLLPCMGSSVFFKDSFFPKLMIEIDGKTVLERVIGNYDTINDKRLIFIMGQDECNRFHVDESASILTGGNCLTMRLKHQTMGALCTCLMAIDKIDNDEPLIISNTDQIIDLDFQDMIDQFKYQDADGGLVTFRNIHPRWSYAKIVGDSVVEVAEKRPISDNAIAGFYYYSTGKKFVEAAERAIRKEAQQDRIYYISSTINEMILMGDRIVAYPIEPVRYHSFYSPEKINEYERTLLK